MGLHFRIENFFEILDWPKGLFEYWRARYLLEPWDAENQRSLGKMDYKAPSLLLRGGEYLTKDEILGRYRKTR